MQKCFSNMYIYICGLEEVLLAQNVLHDEDRWLPSPRFQVETTCFECRRYLLRVLFRYPLKEAQKNRVATIILNIKKKRVQILLPWRYENLFTLVSIVACCHQIPTKFGYWKWTSAPVKKFGSMYNILQNVRLHYEWY